MPQPLYKLDYSTVRPYDPFAPSYTDIIPLDPPEGSNLPAEFSAPDVVSDIAAPAAYPSVVATSDLGAADGSASGEVFTPRKSRRLAKKSPSRAVASPSSSRTVQLPDLLRKSRRRRESTTRPEARVGWGV